MKLTYYEEIFREFFLLTTDQIIMKIEKMIYQFKFHGRLETR